MKYYIEGKVLRPDGTTITQYRDPCPVGARWGAIAQYRQQVTETLLNGFVTVETGPLWSTYRLGSLPNLFRLAVGVEDVR